MGKPGRRSSLLRINFRGLRFVLLIRQIEAGFFVLPGVNPVLGTAEDLVAFFSSFGKEIAVTPGATSNDSTHALLYHLVYNGIDLTSCANCCNLGHEGSLTLLWQQNMVP